MFRTADLSYANDERVLAAGRHDHVISIDEKRMRATLRFDWDGERVEGEVQCEYEVCGTCRGRGHHVNPSIDAHGLTAADFREDPEFASGYRSGRYDVQCSECGGQRVTPSLAPATPDEQALVEKYDEMMAWEAKYRAEQARQRAMGY